MSKGHSYITADERQRAIGELKLALLGKPIAGGPFDGAADLNFEWQAEEDEPELVTRVKAAVSRDSRYATARGPYLAVFGMDQNMFSIFTGGRELINSGAED